MKESFYNSSQREAILASASRIAGLNGCSFITQRPAVLRMHYRFTAGHMPDSHLLNRIRLYILSDHPYLSSDHLEVALVHGVDLHIEVRLQYCRHVNSK